MIRDLSGKREPGGGTTGLSTWARASLAGPRNSQEAEDTGSRQGKEGAGRAEGSVATGDHVLGKVGCCPVLRVHSERDGEQLESVGEMVRWMIKCKCGELIMFMFSRNNSTNRQ